jgi:hypothetical protein
VVEGVDHCFVGTLVVPILDRTVDFLAGRLGPTAR